MNDLASASVYFLWVESALVGTAVESSDKSQAQHLLLYFSTASNCCILFGKLLHYDLTWGSWFWHTLLPWVLWHLFQEAWPNSPTTSCWSLMSRTDLLVTGQPCTCLYAHHHWGTCSICPSEEGVKIPNITSGINRESKLVGKPSGNCKKMVTWKVGGGGY